MKCPKCKGVTLVNDCVHTPDGMHRKRKCKECGHIFYTTEFDVEYDEAFKKEWSDNHRRGYNTEQMRKYLRHYRKKIEKERKKRNDNTSFK